MKKPMSLLFGVLALSGCGKFDWDPSNPRPSTTVMEVPLDGVKLLSPGIRDPHDPIAFQQAEYEIKPQQNLLLRYERLPESYEKISTDNGKLVLLKVTSLDAEKNGRTSLEACPVTRNWSMHAVWALAHPFGEKGIWTTPGGDYAKEGCVVGMQKGRAVTFDVTRWYIDYVRGRRENLGLLLKSETAVRVAGEKNAEGAPRLFFEKFVKN